VEGNEDASVGDALFVVPVGGGVGCVKRWDDALFSAQVGNAPARR